MHVFRPQSARTLDYSGTDNRKDTLSRQASGSYNGQEFSLYVEDDIAFGNRLKLNAGLHYTLFHITGKTYHSIEPRASIRYQCSDRVTFKASYTEMSQFMHQLSNTYLNLPMDFGYLPQKGLHQCAPDNMRLECICNYLSVSG